MTDIRRITTHAAQLTLLKGFSILLTFIVNIYLARSLGASGYGIYAYCTSIIAILSSIAIIGTDRLLLKEIASCRTRHAWAEACGILRWSGNTLIATSTVIIIAALIYISIQHPADPGSLTLLAGLPLIPLFAFLARGQSSLQAVEHPIAGRIAEDIIQPIVFLLTLIAVMGISSITAYAAMGLKAVSFTFALAFIWFASRKILPKQLQSSAADISNRKQWRTVAIKFALINLLLIAHTNINIFMLQWMLTSTAVGVYAVAQRGADLINIIILSFNIVFTPTIIRHNVQMDSQGLERINARLTLILSAAAALIVLAFLIGGQWFLSLFGEEFVAGHAALNILAAGKCANVFFGPVALLLVMTGHEQHNIICIISSAAVNILLNMLLIPSYGIMGAAIASSVGLVFCGAMMFYFVLNKIGINTSITAVLKRR